ncbi:clathrin interactor EPSIN 1-like [Magnolia sinica]|uniref:clathrin interactor EPSIN 1-like n=1 Tax=Magnolia sinica TaxID=86752 RepID=UPI0026581695|nr:clathrin interactor EPSIN 1-like [Magnolia sinica]
MVSAQGDFSFDEQTWKTISSFMKQLISSLLTVDPHRRPLHKSTECQMVMNVLWTRLTDTGRNWRHVYKALTVIEYLVANGSECAVDDIQISSISGFEYVEPNGKDMRINVRKKVETILALLNSKDKIQEVRNKAAANRDKGTFCDLRLHLIINNAKFALLRQ